MQNHKKSIKLGKLGSPNRLSRFGLLITYCIYIECSINNNYMVVDKILCWQFNIMSNYSWIKKHLEFTQ